MSTERHTDEELDRYFADPDYRHEKGAGGDGAGAHPSDSPHSVPQTGYRGFLWRHLGDARKVQAAFTLSLLAGFIVACVLGVILFMIVLTASGRTPSFSQLDNPDLDFATVAYTADGVELGRYGRKNRSWATIDEISPHVINALVATEDHRFRRHWGVDMQGIFAALADIVRKGDLRGASTISQQLARNLYNDQIGFETTPTRKLKEMITAVQLERRYTKDEIIEMYLNTVPFRHNAYGIEAAARTYFGKSAEDLDVLESAALVGMLKANTLYDPERNPEHSRNRRNVVMQQMIKQDFLNEDFYATYRDSLTATNFRSSDVTDSFAPYFAEHVRLWLEEWGEKNNIDIYAVGLVVHTTIDSRMQEMAQEAVSEQMKALQAVVDYEWSARNYQFSRLAETYVNQTDYTPFAYFWESQRDLLHKFVKESAPFKALRQEGLSAEAALEQLLADEEFMTALKEDKTYLQAGLVSIDPRTGYVKAWVGGRDLKVDRYDHIAIAKRQPGSTFKPFVYTAAIDNGYSPDYQLRDSIFVYRDPHTGARWSPKNSGGVSGNWVSLREGLAQSLNTITGQLILEIEPSTAAFYARRMGIQSELDEVPALALGTSDVTLEEMAAAYSTLANGGLYQEPVVVTRIEDADGNLLYEAEPAPREALSEETAFTVVDMMRGVIEYGTGQRIHWQWGLKDYDWAGKTGTTQNSADGWFMLMHPEMVTGAWVGFNDRRIAFRSTFWGQGAHNALFLVGDFMQRLDQGPEELRLSKSETFPTPSSYELPDVDPFDPFDTPEVPNDTDEGRVDW